MKWCKAVSKIILLGVFFILFVSFLANPAPLSIELEDVFLIVLPLFLCVLCLVSHQSALVYQPQYALFLAILFYCAYLTWSVLVGFLNGVPLLNILRAIGPYINFIPLLALGFLPERLMNPWRIAFIFIFIGLIQACFQLSLYFSHSMDILNSQDVLRGRITIFNPRATLPQVLAVAILPLAFLFKQSSSDLKTPFFKNLSICLMLLGLLGGMVTLTRSIVLSVLFGWMLFLTLYAYYQVKFNRPIFSHFNRKFFFYLLSFLILMFIISLVPKIHLLEQGLFIRFFSSPSNHALDYSDGRVYEEWLPALTTWLDSDGLSLFLGIGAGNTFTVASGEERSYIHNLLIYSLVYGGLLGFLSNLGLYFIAFKTLLRHALQSQQIIYLAFAALLGSLFFYALFFAVHKGLAFNAMLFLILALALYQPKGDESACAESAVSTQQPLQINRKP